MAKDLLGALRIRVKRGINLAIRDIRTSDPYVVIKVGKQKVKTRVIKSNCNPEWNEEHTLSISDPEIPIKLCVFDYDRFSRDDSMGEAEIDIKPYMESLKMGLRELPVGTAVKKLQPNRDNCLAEESRVVWMGKGKMVQDMILRLKEVERGEVEIQIEWLELSGTKRFSSRRHSNCSAQEGLEA
ncbi:hypothetical protein V2J09_002208 [Rumex salicifolius]